MEILDIVNDNNELINKRETRKYIHDNFLWHRHVSCWIINEKGEILLQKRAAQKKKNPNKWSKTGGHVVSGEEPKASLKREIEEELGVIINDQDIKLIGIYKSKDKKDRYFGYNFIVKVNYEINKFKLQKEEVSDVKYISINELLKIKKNNDNNYTFNKWKDKDFYQELEIIKKYCTRSELCGTVENVI